MLVGRDDAAGNTTENIHPPPQRRFPGEHYEIQSAHCSFIGVGQYRAALTSTGFLKCLLPIQGILTTYWDESKFNFGGSGATRCRADDAHLDEPDERFTKEQLKESGRTVSIMTTAMKSKVFWAYCQLVLLLAGCLEIMSGWAEGRPHLSNLLLLLVDGCFVIGLSVMGSPANSPRALLANEFPRAENQTVSRKSVERELSYAQSVAKTILHLRIPVKDRGTV